MKTRSRKNKGKRLQNRLKEDLEYLFPELQGELRSVIMGESGSDIDISKRGLELIPFDVECKNQEGFGNIYSILQQINNRGKKELCPFICIKSNRKPPLVIMQLDDFCKWVQFIINKKGGQ